MRSRGDRLLCYPESQGLRLALRSDLGRALNSFVSRISVCSDRAAITILPDALAAWILDARAEKDDRQKTTIITAPVRVQQRGQEMRLVFDAEYELP